MRLKPGEITPRQRVFAEQYARTGDPEYAATKAGYSSPIPRAHENLKSPAVRAHIKENALVYLETEVFPTALKVAMEMLGESKTDRVRSDMVKTVMTHMRSVDAAGLGTPGETDMPTADELGRSIRQVEAMQARLAAETVEPIEAASPAGDDLFD